MLTVSLEQQVTNTSLNYHKVMAWLSPSYPMGAFAYSHGLEFEISCGNIVTMVDVKDGIETLLRNGSGWNELVLFSQAYKADRKSLGEIANLARALAQSKERYEETLALGRAFEKATSAIMGLKFNDMPLPVVMGFRAKSEDIPLEYILPLYAHNFVANLISVGVRLIPLGQTEGQQVLFNLFPVMEEIAKAASIAKLIDVRNSCILADIASMRHETLETRLFRS